MKTIKTVLSLLVLTLMLCSCHKREYWAVRGKGDVVTETRNVAGFSAIRLNCDADVEYTQDSVFRVEVTGQPNVLEVLDIKVVGKELKIDYNRDVWSHKNVKMVVHSPQITAMTISGSGHIRSDGIVNSDHLDLNISGSGNITLWQVDGQNLSATISGSGNTEILGGKVANTTFQVSGSGNINAEYLESQRNTSRISGSGNITVNASEEINVTISGSGDLRYRGTASVNATVSGSGKIRKI